MQYVQTNSGEHVYFDSIDPQSIVLEDIAHALSQVNRFTGHTNGPYSVAQHSVLVARALRDECQDSSVIRAGLMHDAHEAYVGDMSSPLKRQMRAEVFARTGSAVRMSGVDDPDGFLAGWLAALSGFDLVEDRLKDAIARRFRLPHKPVPAVHTADLRMLVTEARDLLPGGPSGDGWPSVAPYESKIKPWGHERARREFLQEAARCDVY